MHLQVRYTHSNQYGVYWIRDVLHKLSHQCNVLYILYIQGGKTFWCISRQYYMVYICYYFLTTSASLLSPSFHGRSGWSTLLRGRSWSSCATSSSSTLLSWWSLKSISKTPHHFWQHFCILRSCLPNSCDPSMYRKYTCVCFSSVIYILLGLLTFVHLCYVHVYIIDWKFLHCSCCQRPSNTALLIMMDEQCASVSVLIQWASRAKSFTSTMW